MNNCIIFTTEKELQKLTGLSHSQLWEKGFNLDDWDIGFCCERKLTALWLLNQMKNYCCGYSHLEYEDKHYYLVYHS